MANYDSLINAVKAAVKTNGTGAITGATLQATLLGTIEELTVGFQFMGVATPETTPDSNDKKEFYLGFAGTYANFGSSVTVPEGKKNDGAWSSQVVKIADPVSVSQDTNTENGVANSITIGDSSFNIEDKKARESINELNLLVKGSFNPEYTIKDGYYINQVGTEAANSVLSRTHKILLGRGFTIKVICTDSSSPSSMSIIAKTNDEENSFVSLVQNGGGSSERTYEYTATEDCYVVVSFRNTADLSIEILFDSSCLNRITTLENAVNGTELTPEYTQKTHYYINANGKDVYHSGALSRTAPIALLKGETISIEAEGSSSANVVSMISLSDENESYFLPIVTNQATLSTYTYKAESDCYVVLSYKLTDDYPVIKKIISSLQEQIRDISNNIEYLYNYYNDLMTIIESKVFTALYKNPNGAPPMII